MSLHARSNSPPPSHHDPLTFANMVNAFHLPKSTTAHLSHSNHTQSLPQSSHASSLGSSHGAHAHSGSHSHSLGHASSSSATLDRLRRERSSDHNPHAHPHHAHYSHRSERGSHSVPPSQPSSASGSKSSSFIGTPRLLSRRSSAREAHRPVVTRSDSRKGKGRDIGVQSEPGQSEPGHSPPAGDEVIETAELRLDRDPGTGRKMINQYLVLHEIGHGTHGRVRLGRDMSVDVPPDELEADLATGSGPFYAIKIVERNPKKKRLAGLGRQRALGRTDGAKLLAENEIRKEIAIVKKLHHPNVVRMKEIIDDPDSSKLYMIFEYCEGGEVQWKGDSGPALTLAETRRIFRDTLLGLEYLHHQGIIHRDIKPSNLLRSGGKVKISDFGCSHFSEALFAAASVGEETYVDDIELAKTVGSPAFFAPEMCYSDLPEDNIPTFTIRPPSTVTEDSGKTVTGADTIPYSPSKGFTSLNDPTTTPRLSASRSLSTSTLPKRPRLPITNAIDVWALGVTLYCLLFGLTPFDAQNEYLLMQVIPTAAYEVPPIMGRDRVSTDGSNEEAREALDLLTKLLEKDVSKRITLDQARQHPFTLRGVPDPKEWLARTDLHTTSYVTVTTDEVAAAVTRGGSIRQKFKRGFNSISRKLGFGRHRSHSVDHTSDAGEHSGSSVDALPNRRVASGNDMPASATPTAASLARRLSLLSKRAESPRPGLLASHLDRNSPPHTAHDDHHTHAHRLGEYRSTDVTPRQLPSVTSLDKVRSDSFRTDSPSRPPRRQSSDVSAAEPRPRSGSNASSSTGSILGALGRNIFSREGSRSRAVWNGASTPSGGVTPGAQPRGRGYTGSSEDTENVFAPSSFASSDAFPRAPSSELLRGQSFDDAPYRTHSVEFESSSPSSMGAPMSPERGWLRNEPVRRGSTLSEDIRPVMEHDELDEEVDWEGAVPDSDDEGVSSDERDGLPQGHGMKSAPADWNLNDVIEDLERKERARTSPKRGGRLLRPVGDVHARSSPLSTPHRAPPTAYSHYYGSPGSSMYRARSPLSPHEPVFTDRQRTPSFSSATSPQPPTNGAGGVGGVSTAPPLGSSYGSHASHASHASFGPSSTSTTFTHPFSVASGGTAGTTPSEAFADADEDDGGIVLARRNRKGSVLSRGSSVRGKSPGAGEVLNLPAVPAVPAVPSLAAAALAAQQHPRQEVEHVGVGIAPPATHVHT